MRDLERQLQVQLLERSARGAKLTRFRLMPEQLCDNPFIVEFIGRHSLRRVEHGWVWKFDS
jgi:hypothetical protein